MFVDDVDGISPKAGGELRFLGSLASEKLEEGEIELGENTGEDRYPVSASEEGLLPDRVSGSLLTGAVISESGKF